jgi:hypothetical protein
LHARHHAAALRHDKPSITNTPLAVSFKLLLALYAIIPLCLLAQLMDSFVLNGALLQYLP